MQRAGSDHNLAVSRDLSHSEKEVSCQSCFLSIRRVTEPVDDTRVSRYIVECKFNDFPTVLQQSFPSTKPEDPEGRTAAIRFALSTDSVTAFRDYLLKYKNQILPQLADNYTNTLLRAGDATVSDVPKSFLSVYTGLRQNNQCGLCFTTAICELIDGSVRCISFRNAEKDIEAAARQVTAFLSSNTTFRKWVKRTVKQDIYDSKGVGTHRLDDVSRVICKSCGDSERSKIYKQDFEDVFCSTCLMKGRMKIIILRVEEQVEQSLTMDKLLTEVQPLHKPCYSNTCCVCGSDDNEYLDDLVFCPCGNSKAVVHSNCATACKSSKIFDSNSNMSCIICGCMGSISHTEDTPQQTIAIQKISPSETGVYRLQICSSTNGTNTGQLEAPVRVAKVERNGSNVSMEPKDMSEKGSARLGRRFNDTPAVVPIKKRRIQLPRSPSPPLVEVSSKSMPVPEKCGHDSTCDSDSSAFKPGQDLHSMNMVRQASLKESECSLAGSPSPVIERKISKQALASPKLIPESVSASPKQQNPKGLEEHPVCSSVNEPIPIMSSVKHESVGIQSENSKLEDLSTPESSSPPERLRTSSVQEPSEIQRSLETEGPAINKSGIKSNHLPEENNSEEVEDGELVISMENNVDDFGMSSESPEVSSQRVRRPRSRGVADSLKDDRSCWDLNTEMETWDKLTRSDGKIKASESSCRLRFRECINTKKMNDCSNESVRRLNSDKKSVELDQHRVMDCRGIGTNNDEDIHREAARDLEPGMDGESRKLGNEGFQGLQENHDCPSENKTLAAKVSRPGRSVRRNASFEGIEDENNADYCKSDYNEPFDVGFGNRSMFHEEEDGYQKVLDSTRNSVSCGSKSLSDCSDQGKKQDDDMNEKTSKSGKTRTTGWDQLPEGFDSAEEALRAAREASSRRGRGPWPISTTRGSTSMGHRFVSGFDSSRESLNNSRTNNQYRDRRLDDPLHSREGFSHLKRMDDNGDDYNSDRGRFSGRASGFHSRSRNSEWDSQDSSMNQWGPDRNRTGSGFSSERQMNCTGSAGPRDSGYIVSSDANVTRVGNVSPTGRGGMRSTFASTGRGPMTTSPGDVESRSSYATRAGDRGAGSINGMGLTGRGYGASSFSNRGPDYRRSPSPGRLHSSDRLSIHRNIGLRPDSRIPRSRLSPSSEETFDRTKFYSKHGSPYSKWSNDRREMDFKRPGPRPYGPPTRTSPHVVHGSSLMDERDLRVLAGTRSSPRSPAGREVLDSGSDFRRMRRSEDGRRTRSHSRDDDPKDSDRDSSRGNLHRREKDDSRSRDSHKLSSISLSGHKRASSRDPDDEVAPRRRRPS